tara:strand:- start:7 stop:246 length:240 start_codon:yes stop_codon:yes gene_type:complete
MIEDSSNLVNGQILKVELAEVKERLTKEVYDLLSKDPKGKLVGYKMVDGNQFGLVLEINMGKTQWFFESELSEIVEIKE